MYLNQTSLLSCNKISHSHQQYLITYLFRENWQYCYFTIYLDFVECGDLKINIYYLHYLYPMWIMGPYASPKANRMSEWVSSQYEGHFNCSGLVMPKKKKMVIVCVVNHWVQFKIIKTKPYLASPADALRGSSRVPAPQERVTNP